MRQGMAVGGIFEKAKDPSSVGFDDVAVDGSKKSGTRLRQLSMRELTSGRGLLTQQRRWSSEVTFVGTWYLTRGSA